MKYHKLRYEKIFKQQFKKDCKGVYNKIVRRKFKNINNDFGDNCWYKKLSPFNLWNYC